MIKKIKKFISQSLDEGNILIYQMGKVGSTALEQSIVNSRHFHTLYNRRCCQFYVDNASPNKWAKIRHYFIDQLRLFLYRRRRSVKIITLVRNPFERDVSHFFQDIHFWISYYILKQRNAARQENTDLIKDCFEELFNFEYSKFWFKEEIERFSGIKIQDCKFDKENGFGYAQRGKYEVLVVRMDKMQDLEREISVFAGVEVKIRKTNAGEAKWYSALYKEFLADYVPSDNVVNRTFHIDWIDIFFTETEVSRMIARALKST